MRMRTEDYKSMLDEEIYTLKFNIRRITKLIHSRSLSTFGTLNAEKLLQLHLDIKNILENTEINGNKKSPIIFRLPLLYLQINKLYKMVPSEIKEIA